MTDKQDGCVKPAAGPIGLEAAADESPSPREDGRGKVMTAQVGREAPDFEASAYVDGGFRNIKLSDYRGQWVTLCFYPGDFTFV
jgi:hypothetical protein